MWTLYLRSHRSISPEFQTKSAQEPDLFIDVKFTHIENFVKDVSDVYWHSDQPSVHMKSTTSIESEETCCSRSHNYLIWIISPGIVYLWVFDILPSPCFAWSQWLLCFPHIMGYSCPIFNSQVGNILISKARYHLRWLRTDTCQVCSGLPIRDIYERADVYSLLQSPSSSLFTGHIRLPVVSTNSGVYKVNKISLSRIWQWSS